MLQKEFSCLVAAADQRSAGHVSKAHLLSQQSIFVEDLRLDVLHHRQMFFGGTQILAESDHVHVHGAQILHGLYHLLLRLAQPQHDAGLGVYSRIGLLGRGQGFEALVVAGPLVPHESLQPSHRLHVVCVHVQPAPGQHRRGLPVPPEVAHQTLHQHLRTGGLDQLHRGGEVGGAPVRHVVPVHAGEDHVVHVPAGHGAGGLEGLEGVRRGGGLGRLDRAEAAAAGARVAQEHDGGGAAGPALSHVGTHGFLADRRQRGRTDLGLDYRVPRVRGLRRRGHAKPRRTPALGHRRPHFGTADGNLLDVLSGEAARDGRTEDGRTKRGGQGERGEGEEEEGEGEEEEEGGTPTRRRERHGRSADAMERVQ
mmetsp:Transcript_8968/g.19824  ORF Transcript_8968/g.19824 Transcript_8968/m.19824 type:complete len:367 (+) Transcript_8968:269-1369(+)